MISVFDENELNVCLKISVISEDMEYKIIYMK